MQELRGELRPRTEELGVTVARGTECEVEYVGNAPSQIARRFHIGVGIGSHSIEFELNPRFRKR